MQLGSVFFKALTSTLNLTLFIRLLYAFCFVPVSINPLFWPYSRATLSLSHISILAIFRSFSIHKLLAHSVVVLSSVLSPPLFARFFDVVFRCRTAHLMLARTTALSPRLFFFLFLFLLSSSSSLLSCFASH